MSYKHILVPVDGSEISFSAVKHAAKLARAFNSQLSLISVVVEDPFQSADFYTSTIMKDYFIQAHANAEKSLVEAKAIAASFGVEAITKIIQGEVSAETIGDTAEAQNIDLIVMGSHGRTGVKKFLLGSFAQDVLHSTHRPVLVIKA